MFVGVRCRRSGKSKVMTDVGLASSTRAWYHDSIRGSLQATRALAQASARRSINSGRPSLSSMATHTVSPYGFSRAGIEGRRDSKTVRASKDLFNDTRCVRPVFGPLRRGLREYSRARQQHADRQDHSGGQYPINSYSHMSSKLKDGRGSGKSGIRDVAGL